MRGPASVASEASVPRRQSRFLYTWRRVTGEEVATTMLYRTLGKTGLDVSVLGYGAWGIGQTMWIGAQDDESLRALRGAIERGVNFIDTAHGYGDGHSERLVGQAIRDASQKVCVATKIPPKNR